MWRGLSVGALFESLIPGVDLAVRRFALFPYCSAFHTVKIIGVSEEWPSWYEFKSLSRRLDLLTGWTSLMQSHDQAFT